MGSLYTQPKASLGKTVRTQADGVGATAGIIDAYDDRVYHFNPFGTFITYIYHQNHTTDGNNFIESRGAAFGQRIGAAAMITGGNDATSANHIMVALGDFTTGTAPQLYLYDFDTGFSSINKASFSGARFGRNDYPVGMTYDGHYLWMTYRTVATAGKTTFHWVRQIDLKNFGRIIRTISLPYTDYIDLASGDGYLYFLRTGGNIAVKTWDGSTLRVVKNVKHNVSGATGIASVGHNIILQGP